MTLKPSTDALIREVEACAERLAERLRETAEELRTGRIHPVHAANRIRQIANEISRPKAPHEEQSDERDQLRVGRRR